MRGWMDGRTAWIAHPSILPTHGSTTSARQPVARMRRRSKISATRVLPPEVGAEYSMLRLPSNIKGSLFRHLTCGWIHARTRSEVEERRECELVCGCVHTHTVHAALSLSLSLSLFLCLSLAPSFSFCRSLFSKHATVVNGVVRLSVPASRAVLSHRGACSHHKWLQEYPSRVANWNGLQRPLVAFGRDDSAVDNA